MKDGRRGDARDVLVGQRQVSRRAFLRTGLAAVASGAVGGCLPDPDSLGPLVDPAHLAARPHTPSLTPDTGANWIGVGNPRDAILYVPDTYDPATPAPLLVTLHGREGDATNWEAFYAKCDLRNMIMLAVESRGHTWDRTGGVFGPDVVFTDLALDFVFERCAIDPEHIALAGFSDGASYALSLGPSNGDLFSHLIAFSPGFTWPSQWVGRPEVWISHGLQDPVLPEEGTRSDIVPELEEHGLVVYYQSFVGVHEVPAAISNAALDWFVA